MNGLGGFLIALLIFLLGMGAEYIRDTYYGSPAQIDTVRVVEYIPQVPVSGTAKPVVSKPKPRPKPVSRNTQQDSVDMEFYVMQDSGYVWVPRGDLDSLQADRTFEIKEEGLGKLTLWHTPTLYPSTEFPSFYWEPAPVKVEYIEVTKEVPISFSQKSEYLLYGAAAGVVLTLLLR